MKKVFFVVMVLVIIGLLWRFFCPYPRTVQIYYPDKNELFLIPISRVVKAPTPALIVRELEKPPSDQSGLVPVFVEHETPTSVTTQGRTILVNFDKFPDLEKSPLLVDALLASFKQLSEFDTVEFSVQGKGHLISNGVELEPESLSEFRINDNLQASNPAYRDVGKKVVIYYVLRGTPYLVPVTQEVATTVPIEAAIAEALNSGTFMPWALQSPLPENSKIVSAESDSKGSILLHVMLNGTRHERKLARKALRLTYTELPSVHRVKIIGNHSIMGALLPARRRPACINREQNLR